MEGVFFEVLRDMGRTSDDWHDGGLKILNGHGPYRLRKSKIRASEGGGVGRRAELPKNSRHLEAQLRSASGRSSKILKDAEGIEAVVEVPGRGTLTLSVQRGGGYSLRAHPQTEDRGDRAERCDLVAVGVLGA